MNDRLWSYTAIITAVIVLVVAVIIIAVINQANRKSRPAPQLVVDPEMRARVQALNPDIKLVLHNHPLGGWWLGLTKTGDGPGWYMLEPKLYVLYDQDDNMISSGEFTYDFRHCPKNTTIPITRGMSNVLTAKAMTGFNRGELWAELDAWSPVEKMP